MECLSDDKGICKICLKDESRYTCPRCNLQYCSVNCYKSQKHADCSESFYKDCFMEGLKDFSASSDEKKNILEILKKVENEERVCDSDDDSDDDGDIDDTFDLAQRLEGVNIETSTEAEAIWNRLSDKEKKEFHKMTSDGRLGNLLQIWTPWWNEKTKPVEEVEKTVAAMSNKPQITTDIPDVTKLLTKSKPSADIKHNLVNILYSYAFICRLYNGEHLDCPIESAEMLFDISDVMKKNKTCGSPTEAIQLCLQKLQERKDSTGESREFNISIVEDIIKILSGPSPERPLEYVMIALSDALNLLKQSSKMLSKEIKERVKAKSKDNEFDTTLKKQIFHGRKKIEFMLGWTQRFGMVLETMVPELQLEFCALSSDLKEVEDTKQKFEENWGGKVKTSEKKLIEEIT